MIKNKFLWQIFGIFFFLIFFFIQEAVGQQSPQQETPTTEISFPSLKDIYSYLILGGIALSLGALIFGGISLVLSLGDPSRIEEGKSWIIGGIIGLLIILSAGFLYEKFTGGKVEEYPKKEAQPIIKGPEFKLIFPFGPAYVLPEELAAGVYLCSKENCPTQEITTPSGERVVFPDATYCQGPYRSSISEIWWTKIKSICVKNTAKEKSNFGYLLFNEPAYRTKDLSFGDIFHLPAQEIFNPSFRVVSIAIFNLPSQDETVEGKIEFYQDSHYRGGVHILNLSLTGPQTYNLAEMQIDYSGTNVPAEVQKTCKTLYNFYTLCLKSLRIIGNYGVFLRGIASYGSYAFSRYEAFLPPGPTELETSPIWQDIRPKEVTIIPFLGK